MNRALLWRSMRDSWLLLASCFGLLTAFLAFRVWVASQIDFATLEAFFATGMPKFFEKLMPVEIEVIASATGRVAFGYEEFPVIVITGLWAIARGSDCLSGRLGAGTMEMLLAQPIRRITLVVSHTLVTLGGAALLGFAGWLGTGLGIELSSFEERPPWSAFAPASVCLSGLCVCFAGIATLFSAITRTRAQTVAIAIGFYVIELTLMIFAMLSPDFAWLGWTTVLNAYDPTALTVGLLDDPATYGLLFWKYNAVLYGIGLASLATAAAIFCNRDVPAPV